MFQSNGIGLPISSNSNFGLFKRFSFFKKFLYFSSPIFLAIFTVPILDDRIKISSQLSKEGLTVTYPSGTYVVHGPIISTNHWNADIVKQSRVLNTLTGKINQVKLIKRGKEIIPIKDGTILATRYDYTGELTDTSVWYDSNGRWSKLEFKARDGSTVEYICNTCDVVITLKIT